jgi:putative DNA-invertase from lambdoid prophage Rac
MPQTRAALYARVSTIDQTCENQLTELRAYAAARGWMVREFVDAGVSAAKESRPALGDLIRAARRRQVDTTTPAGRLQLHVLGAIAEFERERIRERVRAGWRGPRLTGRGSDGPESPACRPMRLPGSQSGERPRSGAFSKSTAARRLAAGLAPDGTNLP